MSRWWLPLGAGGGREFRLEAHSRALLSCDVLVLHLHGLAFL